jgi:hypothetical protein
VQAESRADDFIRAAGSSLAEKPTIFPPGRCRPDEIITELHLPTWLSGRVADRILRYAAIARENVVAGTDYGLGGRVYADLMQDVVLSETEKAHRPVPSIRRHKRATTRLTAPAYWKFESIPLQQTVGLSPDFAVVPGKARVLRQFGDEVRPYGRQRRARSSNIILRSGSVSVGRYFGTAVSPMRLAPVGAPPPSSVAPLGLQQYR